MNKKSLTEKILKGSSIILFFSLLLSPMGYLIRVIYSQTLSIEMYGLFYACLALFTLFTTYNDLGFGYSLVFLFPKFLKKKKYQICWNMFVINVLIELGTAVAISLILIPLAPWISQNYFKVTNSENLIYLFCLYLISHSFLSSIINLFNGLQQEKYYSSVHAVRLFFTLVFSIFFISFKQDNVFFYALAWVISYIFSIIIYYFFLLKNYSFLLKNRFYWDKKLFKTMFKYALPAITITSVGSLITFSDSIFLTAFRGVREVGIYNIVLPLVSISTIFLFPITSLLFPLVSSLIDSNKKQVGSLIENILTLIPFIGVYFALFIVLFPSQPVKLLFGEKWTGLVETPLSILAVGFINFLLSYYLGTIASGMGKVKERLNASLIIAAICIILNAIFVFKFGILGAVLANSLVYIISVILFGRIIKQEINFKYPFPFYIKLFIFSFLIFIFAKFLNLNPQGWVEYISFGFTYTLVMFILAYYLNLFKLDVIKLVLTKSNEKK